MTRRQPRGEANRIRLLRAVLVIVGIIQIATGAVELVAPTPVVAMLGVSPGAAPSMSFVLAGSGARFIGYGIGLLAAARSPRRHLLWIDTMIAIQAVDFIAAVACLAEGVNPSRHLGPAVALPLLWVVLLGWASLRLHRTGPARDQGCTQQKSAN